MTQVKLPPRRNHETPRLLMGDAYTIGSNGFESEEAKEKSVYYITFRKFLPSINPDLYTGEDTRLIFSGLSRLLDYLFYKPVTHQEIDETKAFLKNARTATDGFHDYPFPEELWRRIVDEYNGNIPIEVKALPEGGVFYPNEPVVEITNIPADFGVLAAWFESKMLMIWSSTEMVTQLRHWKKYYTDLIHSVYGNTMDEATVNFFANLMLHDFGDRAGICPQESEWLAADSLLVFSGTDTFAGAYQAWKNSGKSPVFSSVQALAHRNIQSYIKESDCFRALYDYADNNSITSHVGDCYSFWDAVENDLLQLALESKETGNGKVVVARPDSGDPVEQVLWLCKLALKHGLYTEETINGKVWRFGTFLRFIEGDGMTWAMMKKINSVLMEHGFVPWQWGIYGVGGGRRNKISRDNTSTKYAMCAVGKDLRPVVKFSEDLGKGTLPGPFILRRDPESIKNKQTIAHVSEGGEDARVVYYNGTNLDSPFGEIMFTDFFLEIKARIDNEFKTMPETLATKENLGFPVTDKIRTLRRELVKQYAPKKLPQNY